MVNWLLPALFAMSAGAALVVQQAMNAGLRGALSSAAWAGFVSYVVGTLCMVAAIVVLRDPIPSMTAIARAPWWMWWGGALGAAYIALAIVLLPIIGANAFVALLVSGQMIASLVVDHYGLLGLEQRTTDPLKLVGVALLIVGVALIRR